MIFFLLYTTLSASDKHLSTPENSQQWHANKPRNGDIRFDLIFSQDTTEEQNLGRLQSRDFLIWKDVLRIWEKPLNSKDTAFHIVLGSLQDEKQRFQSKEELRSLFRRAEPSGENAELEKHFGAWVKDLVNDD